MGQNIWKSIKEEVYLDEKQIKKDQSHSGGDGCGFWGHKRGQRMGTQKIIALAKNSGNKEIKYV
jgi:hypothetical protein